MPTSDNAQSGIWPWIRWALISEGLILLFALAGPGYRHRGDHALFARCIMEDPSYLDAVLVNFVTMHLLGAYAWLTAWIVTRLRAEE